ncbi:DUF3667 domain-containing protein [Phenylobacterium sp.]|jgi:hypothetical protein|uniref:DUF3667 domain-containing protein n=1 Tax=Phenylobacterium sp. TaxID=1871053 RepID=UPI002F418742
MASGDNLLEAVTADTIAHEAARASKHSLPIGAPCPNCRTAIAGPWCYACGQRAEKYDRSIWRLFGEMFEGLVDLDGRIWKTFPRLIFRPGKLTREYLDGHRAAQVPPFRIFLIVLLVVFFAGGQNFARNKQHFQLGLPNDPKITANMSDKDKADYAQAMAKLGAFKAGQDAKPSSNDALNFNLSPPNAAPATATQGIKIGPNDTININTGSAKSSSFWTTQVKKALANPDAFFAAAAEWANRLAVIMLPIAALMLSALFVFKRNTYVFDHLIFSMHSLSFQGLLLSAVFLGAIYWDPAWNLLWLSPVHLFFHMRGAYRVSWYGTLLRMFALFIASSVVFGLMIGALVMIGIATVQ